MSAVSRGGRYIRFLGLALTAVLALVIVGFLPTRRLAGEAGIPAMVAGCLISLAAAALAAWLLVAMPASTPIARMQRASLAMTVRLVVVAVVGGAVVFGGELARMPLLFWLAVSYVVLLPFEIRLAIAPE
jgi:hypothetical protein